MASIFEYHRRSGQKKKNEWEILDPIKSWRRRISSLKTCSEDIRPQQKLSWPIVEELAISALTKINEQAKKVMRFEKLNSAFV